MSEGQRIPLNKAIAISEEFIALISDACERVEVAGSIRRRSGSVGDVEICCIPKLEPDLFGDEGDSLLDYLIVGR